MVNWTRLMTRNKETVSDRLAYTDTSLSGRRGASVVVGVLGCQTGLRKTLEYRTIVPYESDGWLEQ